MKKFGIPAGSYQELFNGKSYPNYLDLNKVIEDYFIKQGIPVSGSCCYTINPNDYGKILSITATGITLLSPASSGVGAISDISLGALTSTTNQIVVTGGNNFLINSATSTEAGLLSSTLFDTLNNLSTSGLTSSLSITGNGLIGSPFTLVNDLLTPGNNVYYGTDNLGVKGYYSLPPTLVEADTNNIELSIVTNTLTADLVGIDTAPTGYVPSKTGTNGITWINPVTPISNSFKYIQLVPTGINTIPDLTVLPLEPTEVIINVNGDNAGLGITVDNAGVFTVNPIILGYDVDSQDKITVIYFSI